MSDRYRAPIGVVLVAAAYVACVAWPRAYANAGVPNFDTYTSYVPNALYAVAAIERGSGLLWNRLQNCGQPFFAVILTAVAYPLHALLLVLDVDTAMLLLLFVHLAIGGLGTYVLARQLGSGRWASLCASIVFELGATTLLLGYWSPINLAVYAWMPVALAACERLLRRPSPVVAAVLAGAVAMQLLAGYPQVAVFTWQLIALRVLWEALTARELWRWRAAVLVGTGLVVGAALAAVQLLPALEATAESLRGGALTMAEMPSQFHLITWAEYRATGGVLAFGLVPLAVAGMAWTHPAQRRVASFFALVAVVYGVLAFDSPLLAFYRWLPFGSIFRGPERFLWVSAFCVCVLVALGADALARAPTAASRSVACRLLPLWGVLAVAYGLATPATLVHVGGIGAAITLLVLVPPGRVPWALAVGLPVLIAAQLLTLPQLFAYQRDSDRLFDPRAVFAAVQERMTPQDRMYQVAMPSERLRRYGVVINPVIKKSGMLFGIPSIVDYEPQTSARYAAYSVRMFYGRPMRSLNDAYYDLRWVPRVPSLFDLTAARFVVIDEEQMARLHWPAGDQFALRWQDARYRLYENRNALPRARYVPELESIPDPATILERLAAATDDPRRLVLVEGEPGRRGGAGGTGTAAIEADDSERLRIRVQATAAGFLVLADQYYPGWEATVNGQAAPILRANYAFRAVAVPAGDALVEFRYRAPGLVVGGVVTALALVAILFLASRRASPS